VPLRCLSVPLDLEPFIPSGVTISCGCGGIGLYDPGWDAAFDAAAKDASRDANAANDASSDSAMEPTVLRRS
jgi:hypothetical protein